MLHSYYLIIFFINRDRAFCLSCIQNFRLNCILICLQQIFQPGGAGGYFVPTLPQPQRFYGPQMAQIRATPRWPAQPQVRPNAQAGASGFPNMQGAFRTAPRAPGAQPGSMRNALSARPITGQQPVGAANIQGRPMAPTVSVSAQGRPTNYKYTSNMRNPPQPMPVAQQPPVQQVSVLIIYLNNEVLYSHC